MANVDGLSYFGEFWLFGYGLVLQQHFGEDSDVTRSLIWKPPPHFDKRIPGYVEGYVRRFWQASEDHRGTPEAPGCVVTLIERSFWEKLVDHHDTSENQVWGAAYRIESSKVAEVQDYLDVREINGYSIQYTQFHPEDSSIPPIRCLVYIGLPDNPQFLGPQEPQALAEHIVGSVGPSGENREYLFMLEKALVELGKESGDSHVQDLATRVRQIDTSNGKPALPNDAIAKEASKGRHGIVNGQQEEVEKVASV